MEVQTLLKLRALEMKEVKARHMKIFQIMKENNKGNRALEWFERQVYVKGELHSNYIFLNFPLIGLA